MSYVPAIDTLVAGPCIAGTRILINHTGMSSMPYSVCEEKGADSRVRERFVYVESLERAVLEFADRITTAYRRENNLK